jgi:hypothetical protein
MPGRINEAVPAGWQVSRQSVCTGWQRRPTGQARSRHPVCRRNRGDPARECGDLEAIGAIGQVGAHGRRFGRQVDETGIRRKIGPMDLFRRWRIH